MTEGMVRRVNRTKASFRGSKRNERGLTVTSDLVKLERITEIVQEKFPGSPEELEVFRSWLEILNRAQIPYLLAGAFAVYLHTGIWRDTISMPKIGDCIEAHVII